MKLKLLTKRQQLGIFNCSNPIALMREYVSFSKDIKVVTEYKSIRLSYKRNPNNKELYSRLQKMNLNERQVECLNNLSFADLTEICYIGGHVYPEVLLKMLEVFPKDISKELLGEYIKHFTITDDIRMKALEVLGKDAIDIILPQMHLTASLFKQIMKTLSKEEVKKMLIDLAKEYDCRIEHDEVEAKILKVFSDEDLKDILRAFIDGLPWMSNKCFLKIFDIYPQEEVKELLQKAINKDMDIWLPTLLKTVEYFPKEDAKELVEAFWNTSAGKICYTNEKAKITKLLNEKQ